MYRHFRPRNRLTNARARVNHVFSKKGNVSVRPGNGFKKDTPEKKFDRYDSKPKSILKTDPSLASFFLGYIFWAQKKNCYDLRQRDLSSKSKSTTVIVERKLNFKHIFVMRAYGVVRVFQFNSTDWEIRHILRLFIEILNARSLIYSNYCRLKYIATMNFAISTLSTHNIRHLTNFKYFIGWTRLNPLLFIIIGTSKHCLFEQNSLNPSGNLNHLVRYSALRNVGINFILFKYTTLQVSLKNYFYLFFFYSTSKIYSCVMFFTFRNGQLIFIYILYKRLCSKKMIKNNFQFSMFSIKLLLLIDKSHKIK